MTSKRARLLIVVVLLAFVQLGVSLLHAPAEQLTPTNEIEAIEAIAIAVSDIDRAVGFYSRVLFFEKVADAVLVGAEWDALFGLPGVRARVVTMRLGDERIELAAFDGPPGRPLPADSRSNDRWFQHIAVIVNDMDQAYLWLMRQRVEAISPAPQPLPDWNPNAGDIRAFYFRDPDGHPLEILEFPSGKGDARWHRPSDQIFLGIDHTAIVVGDTARSVQFYRDALGMRVAGTSENYGPEQARLNNVAGARLRITTLRAPAGPGVELLEYVQPAGGRSIPADTRANDLAAWRTVAGAAAPRLVFDRLVTMGSSASGAAPVTTPGPSQFIVRDPDGHLVHVRPH
jgi:catechol 2,3-dioxygenase-like lactoylglutathione lyase family enzyme